MSRKNEGNLDNSAGFLTTKRLKTQGASLQLAQPQIIRTTIFIWPVGDQAAVNS
jgi:hypothetical protein